EADHERAAVHTVDVAVLGDQRPAGPTDLLQLVEDRGPVAAHLTRLDAPGRRLRRRRRLLCRCRRLLLCRGVLRGCLLGSRLLRSRLLRRARVPRTLRTGALSRGALRAALLRGRPPRHPLRRGGGIRPAGGGGAVPCWSGAGAPAGAAGPPLRPPRAWRAASTFSCAMRRASSRAPEAPGAAPWAAAGAGCPPRAAAAPPR